MAALERKPQFYPPLSLCEVFHIQDQMDVNTEIASLQHQTGSEISIKKTESKTDCTVLKLSILFNWIYSKQYAFRGFIKPSKLCTSNQLDDHNVKEMLRL